MMTNKALVFDIEGNGLREEITKVHCIVARDIQTKEIFKLYKGSEIPLEKDPVHKLFQPYDSIIGHNIINYDLPILKRFFDLSLIRSKIIIDTLIWSKTLFPDRQLAENCPKSIFNLVTKKCELITPHSLAAWGYRVGKKKPSISDWRVFNMEILKRCEEDVLINELTYYELLKESGL